MKTATANPHKTKELFKLLMAAAWLDGEIQIEEREYLHKMAQENALCDDPEIRALLSEAKQIPISDCYEWAKAYLGDNPGQTHYEELLESLSALIYSDGDVHTEEAKFLVELQQLDPATTAPQSIFDGILKTVQKAYRSALKKQS
ncbi:MAG: TerB family tellurite resistance protein [Cyanobacteria bacterium SBLK]|nr:TerB family tellurite resistance protein [Cyanobacteria bacterium SBLK]